MTTSLSAPTLVERLVQELDQLPASRGAALQVVRVVDDPNAGAADVSRAASMDPALTARILRVANSVYYGLSGRVGTPSFAITVIGFQTVRSLAAVTAAGLASPDALPPGFWKRATAVASGASLVAPRVRAAAPEAFCAGLLHDLGDALLRQHDRAAHDRVLAAVAAQPDPWARTREELREFGGSHAELCAEVLGAWHFPEELCEAIAGHHAEPSRTHPPLQRALIAGQVLADLADLADTGGRVTGEQQEALSAASVPAQDVRALVEEVIGARDALSSAFSA